jgi:hypothetical protein
LCAPIILAGTLNSCNEIDYFEEIGSLKYKSFKSKIAAFENASKTELGNRNNVVLSFISEMESPSLNYLKSFGLTESEVYDELGSLDEGALVYAAEMVMQLEIELESGLVREQLESNEDYVFIKASFFNQAFAQGGDTVGGCLLDASGIGALGEVASIGVKKYLKKEGVKKVLRKTVGKVASILGWGLAAYDFADCMNWL